jgi:hypothetical protein
VLPGQILDTGEPPPADFIAKLRQSGPPPPSRPLSYAQMAAEPPAALLSAAFEREETVSIDRLKPHRGAAPIQPALPPARGRPRAR